MATTIYRHRDERLDVTRYIGPSVEKGGDRTRYQITVISDEDGRHHSTTLSLDDYREFQRIIGQNS